MKRKLVWVTKAVTALLITFGIVSGISFFYYNLPVHYANKTGATDYFWDKNSVSVRATEGFAYTETDSEGFVNTYPEKKENIDILIMGSSHTEGFYVNSDENYTYVLNEKLKDGGYDKYAYNIGASGHDLLRCLRNLEDAIKTYQPTEYVIIETHKTKFSAREWLQLNGGEYEVLTSYNSGVLYHLQKFDFIRLALQQISDFLKKEGIDVKGVKKPQNNSKYTTEEYESFIDTAVSRVSEIASEYNCKIIVVYCPALKVDYYGNVTQTSYSSGHKMFVSSCEKYGVEFVDMFDAYKTMYDETKRLPTGFSNTAVGYGHTNKYGNKCIADELYGYVTG